MLMTSPHPYADSTSNTSTPRDIINGVLTICNLAISFPLACECEEGEISKDDVSAHIDQFEEWDIPNGGGSSHGDVNELSHSNVELMDSIHIVLIYGIIHPFCLPFLIQVLPKSWIHLSSLLGLRYSQD